jgi:hypothetical protein
MNKTRSRLTKQVKMRRPSLARRTATRALSQHCESCYGLRMVRVERYEPLYRINVGVMVPCKCTQARLITDFKTQAAGGNEL